MAADGVQVLEAGADVGVSGAAELGSGEAGLAGLGSGEAGLAGLGSGEAGLAELGSGEAGLAGLGSGEAGLAGLGSGEAGLAGLGSGEAGLAGLGCGEAGAAGLGCGEAAGLGGGEAGSVGLGGGEAGTVGRGCVEAGAAGLGGGEAGAVLEGKGPTEAVSGAESGLDHKCLFCKIGNEKEAVELLHLDDQFACFKDIRPGAPHHYLVVPRNHVGNCKTLKREHVSTVEKMVEVGKSVLQQKGISDLADVRLGFHWPPFCSMAHLHLHVLAPASRMGFLSRMVYKSNSYWFITVDQLIERLKSFPEDSGGKS